MSSRYKSDPSSSYILVSDPNPYPDTKKSNNDAIKAAFRKNKNKNNESANNTTLPPTTVFKLKTLPTTVFSSKLNSSKINSHTNRKGGRKRKRTIKKKKY